MSSRLKVGYGSGVVVAVLLPLAASLFSLIGAGQAVSLVFTLVGVWTIFAAYFVVESRDRYYYASWGVVMAAISLYYYIGLQATFGLILLAIVAMVLLNIFVGRSGKAFKAATTPPSPAGDTPAASPS